LIHSIVHSFCISREILIVMTFRQSAGPIRWQAWRHDRDGELAMTFFLSTTSKSPDQAKKKKTKTPHHLSGLGAALAATLRVGAAGLAAIPLETARVAAKEAIVEEGCAGEVRRGWS
jgi:hypothetical protein